MTSQERRHFMRLLQQAKQGDELACEQLTAGLAKKFQYMIRGYNSVDPAFDRDDLLIQFQLGIWQSISKVDGRGDPLFHLAWRGRRAVCSLLTAIKRRRHGTEAWVAEHGGERSVGTLPETWDVPDSREDANPDFALLLAESRQAAQDQVRELLQAEALSDKQRRLVEVMSITAIQGEDGVNLRTARALGVSAQAAGVLHGRVLSKLGVNPASTPTFDCLACGRGFKSKGALTQHQRGQSGHRPCSAMTAS